MNVASVFIYRSSAWVAVVVQLGNLATPIRTRLAQLTAACASVAVGENPRRRLKIRRRLLAILLTSVPLVLAAVASADVSVFPSPGSRLATPQTQISFRGVVPGAIGQITVIGSHSGIHVGQFKADSDGRGASFYPAAQFSPGERVTVRTHLPIVKGNAGTFRFAIERGLGHVPAPGAHYVPPRVPGDVRTFRSRPDLIPAAIRIRRSYSGAQDIFLTPMRGPRQWGPMIVDRRGSVIWFHPLPGPRATAADLNVQQYMGKRVLTWWQGTVNHSFGQGDDVIFDRHYRQIATVRAGNGLAADLHEFSLTPRGTALIDSYSAVRWDGKSVGGPRDMDVLNCDVQEIDVRTGNVLFQWDSLDHVPLSRSYARGWRNTTRPYDYFHLNSIQLDEDGNLIVSARNTWAVYKINHSTGAVMWELGGRHSSFKMGPGTRTAYQHDAQLHPGGLITVFDDGAWPQVHPQSRAILERIDTTHWTATLLRALEHSPSLVSRAEGSVQLLPNGHWFIGWGEQPYFTEFDRRGRQLFDGRFVGPISSYRAYEYPWHGQPATPPSLALERDQGGISTLYASWNGATDVSWWQVLAGNSPTSLTPVGIAIRHGFETAIHLRNEAPYFAVRALGRRRQTLGQSSVAGSLRARVSIFGHSAFISSGGVGGLQVGCFATHPCQLSGSLSTGHTKIASVASQGVQPQDGGIVFFRLSSQGRHLLAHARHHRLAVNAGLRNLDGAAAFAHLTLVPYRTSGQAPSHQVHQARSLRIVAHTAFISPGRVGGIFAECPATTCHVTLTIQSGGRPIGSGTSQRIPAGNFGILFFKLTSAGMHALNRTPSNDLPAKLTARNGGDTAVAQISLIRSG